jgi:NAD(P)-dependent dehydrogenase (short-subunit alcohol dehydrogenase family)
MDEARQMFEVNVLGLLAVTQAFLPLLGARNDCPHPPGRIVNISSISGGLAFPLLGIYAGSKHAVEALTDAMRRELDLFGIRVSRTIHKALTARRPKTRYPLTPPVAHLPHLQ